MTKEPTRLVAMERNTQIWRRNKHDAPYLHLDAPSRHDEFCLHSKSPHGLRAATASEGALCASSASVVLCVREATPATRLPPLQCRRAGRQTRPRRYSKSQSKGIR